MMKLKREETLRNGETLLLRCLCAQDAQCVIDLCRKTAGETMNMSRYRDEWRVTPQQEAEWIQGMACHPKELMLGGFISGEMIGLCSMRMFSDADRARHRAGVGISILRRHWGKGVGTAMLGAAVEAARGTNLEQLELEVVAGNEAAIRLYRRFGFSEYGRRPRGLKYRDGTYADMVLMMLDLRAKP